LGDTKLFEAAVLPAILVARRSAAAESQDCEFIRVYEVGAKAGAPTREADSVLEVLDGSFAGRARVNGVFFQVETGRLQAGTDSRTPWSITNRGVASWLATVRGHSSGTFSDVAKVCVGIKTTADSVFVRMTGRICPPKSARRGSYCTRSSRTTWLSGGAGRTEAMEANVSFTPTRRMPRDACR